MPQIAKKNYEIRQQLAIDVGDWETTYIATTTFGSSTTIIAAAAAGWGDDFFNNWEIYIFTGVSSGDSRRVTDYTSSSGTFTVDRAWTSTPTATSEFELHKARSGFPSVAIYNSAIKQAIQRVQRKALTDKTDESIALEADRYLYPIPADYTYISKLFVDDGSIGGDRLSSDTYDAAEDLLQLSTNVELGQGFKLKESKWVDGIYIFMRKVGSPTQSLVARFETDSSGAPSGTLLEEPAGTPTAGITNAVASTVFTADHGFVFYDLPRPIFIPKDTQYHWLIKDNAAGGATADAYYQVGVDTGGGYADGKLNRGSGSSTWVAVAGSDLIFRLREASAYRRTRQLLESEWNIDRDTTRHIRLFYNPQDGATLKIIGQRYAKEPATDATNVDIEASALVRIAAGVLAKNLPPRSGTNQHIDKGVLIQMAEQAVVEYRRVQVIPGSRTVEVH